MQTGTDIRTMLERLGHACLATTFPRWLALALGVYKLLLSKRASAEQTLVKVCNQPIANIGLGELISGFQGG